MPGPYRAVAPREVGEADERELLRYLAGFGSIVVASLAGVWPPLAWILWTPLLLGVRWAPPGWSALTGALVAIAVFWPVLQLAGSGTGSGVVQVAILIEIGVPWGLGMGLVSWLWHRRPVAMILWLFPLALAAVLSVPEPAVEQFASIFALHLPEWGLLRTLNGLAGPLTADLLVGLGSAIVAVLILDGRRWGTPAHPAVLFAFGLLAGAIGLGAGLSLVSAARNDLLPPEDSRALPVGVQVERDP